jgi:hypothetical protein
VERRAFPRLENKMDDRRDIVLRLSAQRALWGNVPSSLRSVSVEERGTTIHFRAVFSPEATEEDRELLSVAATEVIADFPAPFMLEEEFLEIAPPAEPEHLRYLIFLRAEPKEL